MNVVREIERINDKEIDLGLSQSASWHDDYKDTSWVYVGGLAFNLNEGDVLCVMEQ